VVTGLHDTREKVYILLNKPKKLADGRRSEYRVFELVKGSTCKIGAVGEWTKHNWFVLNDTDMIRKFTLPSQNHLKFTKFL
jgi:hypothetical protein